MYLSIHQIDLEIQSKNSSKQCLPLSTAQPLHPHEARLFSVELNQAAYGKETSACCR